MNDPDLDMREDAQRVAMARRFVDGEPMASVWDEAEIRRTLIPDGLSRSDDHRYFWTVDGVIHVPEGAPGVTTVLKQLDKSGPFWAAASRIVAEKAVGEHQKLVAMIVDDGPIAATDWLKASTRDKSQKAMDLGSLIHRLIEEGTPDPDVPDEAAPYMTMFAVDFLLKYAPTYEHVETMVYSEAGAYGGTLDAICMIGGQRWLIDYKTSDKPIGKSPTMFPYADVALQLAALGFADFIGKPQDPTRYPIPHIDKYGVVAITPNDCQLIEYQVTDAEWQTFLRLRGIHEWVKTRKGAVKR
jgi:hypothetical protein